MKIVVHAPNWIGDSILALPAVESLHSNYPEAEIWIAAQGWVKDIFANIRFIKGIISLPAKKSFKDLRKTANELRSYNFEAGLLLTNSFGSALLFFMAKIPQRWGYGSDGRQILLTKKIRRQNRAGSNHQVYHYLNLISGLGLKTDTPHLALAVTEAEKKKTEEFLDSIGVDLNKLLFILNPGAFYGSAKRWPVEKYIELAKLLQENYSPEILIIGSAQEVELANAIDASLEKKLVILAGKTSLRQLVGVLSRAALCVTNDSGPMHMANALKVPTVALFGPTDPEVTAPFQEPSVYIKKDVPCWPCAYRECLFDHRCMRDISSEEVFKACKKLLS
jgi:heptosyltransferase-2